MGAGCCEEAPPENREEMTLGVTGDVLQTHDAALDFRSDFEGTEISAYELAGCYIGSCHFPMIPLTTSYIICPDDHDHYTARGCRWS